MNMEAKGSTWSVFPRPSPSLLFVCLFVWHSLFIDLRFVGSARLARQQDPEIRLAPLHLCWDEIRATITGAVRGFRGSNTGPHACTSGTLLSPQSRPLCFWIVNESHLGVRWKESVGTTPPPFVRDAAGSPMS